MGRVIVYRATADALKRLDIEADTLDEATLKTGHGIYTVFRMFTVGRVLRMDQHLQRMRRSAELTGRNYNVSDEWLREMARQVVSDAKLHGITMPRVRITVPFDDPSAALFAVEPFEPPSDEVYEKGVVVGLVNAHRDDPRVKSSFFIEKRGALAAEQPKSYYEIILTSDDGAILEGAGSNFYAVLDGELCTADEGMLPGITRAMVLEVAEDVIPVRLKGVNRSNVPRISEAMISSASRGIVPIVQIDAQIVGDGVPGAIFRMLRERYDLCLEATAAGWSYEKLINTIVELAATRQGIAVAANS